MSRRDRAEPRRYRPGQSPRAHLRMARSTPNASASTGPSAWNRMPKIEPGKTGRLSRIRHRLLGLFPVRRRAARDRRRPQAARNTSLFAYEAGAIHENKRHYDRALSEYATRRHRPGKRPGSNSAWCCWRAVPRYATPSSGSQRTVADRTMPPLAGVPACASRAREPEPPRRSRAVPPSAAAGRDSLDMLDADRKHRAASEGFPKVQEAAMMRRFAIMTDPVEKMRYHLALAHFYEDQSSHGACASSDALYQANPTMLGVVRAAADYHWRKGKPKRAVERSASQPFAHSRSISARSGWKPRARPPKPAIRHRARILVGCCCKVDPYRVRIHDRDGRNLCARGRRSGPARLLPSRRFASALPTSAPREKTERIAAMRRALIPVLTRVKDYSAALDQYIEILNRYPEDEALHPRSRSYAAAITGRQADRDTTPRLGRFSADFRWPMVLARIETRMEEFPEASRPTREPLAVRPDRTDLGPPGQPRRAPPAFRRRRAQNGFTTSPTTIPCGWNSWPTSRPRRARSTAMVAALHDGMYRGPSGSRRQLFQRRAEAGQLGHAARGAPVRRQGSRTPPDGTDHGTEFADPYAQIMGAPASMKPPIRLTANGTEPEGSALCRPRCARWARWSQNYYTPEEKTAFAQFIAKTGRLETGLGGAEAAGARRSRSSIAARHAAGESRGSRTPCRAVDRTPAPAFAVRELGGAARSSSGGQRRPRPMAATLCCCAASAYDGAGDAGLRTAGDPVRKAQSGLDAPLIASFCPLLAQQPQALINVAGTDPPGDMRDMAANCAIENSRPADALAAVHGARQGRCNPCGLQPTRG